MSYPEIVDEFDSNFPRDSYDRAESILPFEVGRKHKKSKKHRSKTRQRSFKMPMQNDQAQSQNAANQNQSMQPYGEPDYSDDRSGDPGSSHDTHGDDYSDYDSDLGYDEIGRKKKQKHKSISASEMSERLRKQREADKRRGIMYSSVAVSKAVKRLKEKEAYKKSFEDKIAALEHQIERKDIDEETRNKLEDQADEYEGMIEDLKESQRQELDEVRANEAESRNPDTDPTFAITETDDMVSGVAYIPSDDGVVVVGAEVHYAPIYAEVLGEFNNQVGNRFTDFFHKIGNVVRKIANNRIVRKLVSLAKGIAKSPALTSMVPGAGQMVAAAKMSSGLVKGLEAKNPKAIAVVKQIAAKAESGDPESAAAMEHLNKAAKIHKESKELRYARAESRGNFNWDVFYRMGMMHGIR